MSCCKTQCFHCNASLPEGPAHFARVDGKPVRICSTGCKTAVETIGDAGLSNFYRYRTKPSPPSCSSRKSGQQSEEWSAFDREDAQRGLVTTGDDGTRKASIWIEGVRCAACTWLLEQTLSKQSGVLSAEVDLTNSRAHVRWHPEKIALSRILGVIDQLGYRPHPLRPDEKDIVHQCEKRMAMKQLAVAGLGMMQVMTYAVALYAGAFQGIDATIESFLRAVSMLVATPVLLYAGRPFFASAWRDLRNKQLGMDVPVSLALGAAYAASIWNTLRGSGEIYFDSVTMFVFLLSLGRYVEMLARHQTGNAAEAVSRLLPDTAVRLEGQNQQTVAVRELRVGERVLVRAGEVIPADGRIAWGSSRINESLLTGESEPLSRTGGDRVLAGSLNIGGPLHVELTKVAEQTILSEISRLLEKAQAHRPRLARLADRVAGRFIGAVLLLAAATAVYWWHTNPELAFPITLSVLVVTCPCALSLATPTALTAATGYLASRGVLITRANALETLARVDRVVLDKTGTLTRGEISLKTVTTVAGVPDFCLRVAGALERDSEHPISAAFGSIETGAVVSEVENFPGAGIQGVVDDVCYRIGTRDFVAALSRSASANSADVQDFPPGSGGIYLGDRQRVMARFELSDDLRTDAFDVTRELAGLGLALEIASGDRADTVARIAAQVGISDYRGRLKPRDKLELIRERQSAGETVLAVGDGINDAPVLAGANVSAAVASGSPLAQVSADMVLLGESLNPLVLGITTAYRTMRVIRQNLIWALCYNAVALPLATTGWIQPWMAVIGMSASSLLVVLNALRLTKTPRMPGPAASDETLTPVMKGLSG